MQERVKTNRSHFKLNQNNNGFLSFLHKQMQMLGRSFNYAYHKTCLVASFLAAITVTYGILIGTFASQVAEIGATHKLVIIHIYIAILVGAHLVLIFIFAYLLINVKVRFRMLNLYLW